MDHAAVPVWKKSSRSANQSDCVEVAKLATDAIGVRDSKLGDESPILKPSPAAWMAFIGAVRADAFN